MSDTQIIMSLACTNVNCKNYKKDIPTYIIGYTMVGKCNECGKELKKNWYNLHLVEEMKKASKATKPKNTHKKISHVDKNNDFLPMVARYYCGDTLMLEVGDFTMFHNHDEVVIIGGIPFTIFSIVSYPESMIIEYHLKGDQLCICD